MRLTSFSALLVTLLALWAPAQAQSPAVAGLKPFERPAGAPKVAEKPRSAEQLAQDLRGVSAPIPGNLQNVAATTGNWYSPLRLRGMPPPYDPRGLHGTAQPAQLNGAAAPTSAR